MDALHERLAQLALARIRGLGFCLAGGYAINAHGFGERPSEDVDLFTVRSFVDRFPVAVREAVAALADDGLAVSISLQNAEFARLQVTDPDTGRTAKMELGVDWRAHPPVVLTIGPVLHPDDAVANKMCALYSRAQTRDYLDVDSVVASGRYAPDELLRLARNHDPGFDDGHFASALRAVRRLPIADFLAYGLSEEQAAEIAARAMSWADHIDGKRA